MTPSPRPASASTPTRDARRGNAEGAARAWMLVRDIARRDGVPALLLVAAIVITGRVALLFPQAGFAGVQFWPPAGIALFALWRWGPGMLLPLAVGFVWLAASTGMSLGIGAMNVLAALMAPAAGAWWLERRGFDDTLTSTRDAALWSAASLLPTGLLAVTVSLWREPQWLDLSARALDVGQRWIGFGLSVFVVGMTLLATRRRNWAAAWLPHRRWGNVALMFGALASAFLAFLDQPDAPQWLTPLALMPAVFLCLLVLRQGLPLAAWSVVLIGAAATGASAQGIGVFVPVQPAHALALLWGYVGALATVVLWVAALAGESLRMKDRWQVALQGPNLGVADWHLRGGPGFSSRRWRHMTGDGDGRRSATLKRWLEQVHELDRPRLSTALDALIDGPAEASLREQIRLRAGDDIWTWFELHAAVGERDERGRALRLVASLADINQQRAVEDRQRLSAALFQHAHEGLLVADADLRVLDANPSCSQILGVARSDLIGRVPALLQAHADEPESQARLGAMWASLRTAGAWRGEVNHRRRDGHVSALQLTVSVVRGDAGDPQRHVVVLSDVTDQRDQRERLERQAHFDELTRLPNRTRLAQTLTDAMAAADRDGHLLIVCYLDLDHFKPVNDLHGHAMGDRLLVDVAQRLRGALRGNSVWADTVARLGGDEFVLLMRARGMDEARLAVERVQRVVAEPYQLANGAVVQVSASVGATVYPLDRNDADTLLRHADHAMYSAKQDGRNRYQFFDREHSRRTEERVMAIGRVQEALDKGELELYYQPKVDMRRGLVLGVEALLRWNHPERGTVMPAQFLPMIEHTGLSAHIGDWVLEHALEQLAAWQAEGVDLSVSVNVSARHLQEPAFAQRLAELLARHERPLGPKLELEVVESAALADVDYTSDLLARCRRLGVRFALDDFGTGYSTLTYLKRLPVDALKVDRSFVHTMLDDRQDLAIVDGVVSLARTFGCQVIAEGVETAAQARQLIEMGCDIGQGHGIARPMRAGEVAPWARNYRGPFSISTAPAARA